MMELECFLSAIGMAKSMNVLIYSSLGQQIVDFAAPLIHWQWKSSCKNLCDYKYIVTTITFYSCTNFILYYFSKSGSGWAGGIRNIYHDPCQDWMDLINMKLTSPNYPDPYNPLDNCSWKIIAPQGHYVTLDFEIIDVSIYTNKANSFALKITIRNGNLKNNLCLYI